MPKVLGGKTGQGGLNERHSVAWLPLLFIVNCRPPPLFRDRKLDVTARCRKSLQSSSTPRNWLPRALGVLDHFKFDLGEKNAARIFGTFGEFAALLPDSDVGDRIAFAPLNVDPSSNAKTASFGLSAKIGCGSRPHARSETENLGSRDRTSHRRYSLRASGGSSLKGR